ncbi:MAG TPA: cytochrome c biogenesis protein CcsA [Candidatus Margulisiibacteriota bacterium]|nr:cytochrome c biogenesis protein CcsA [Candidatus Margulisiibacteriota bacterium]
MRTLADAILPPVTLVVMLAAIYMVFVYVPTDKVQGIVQRIFYFHVPLAIMTFVAFGTVAVASALFLWRGRRASDRVAHAAAEVGMVFCTLVLITGPIWARPVWGTWWTWDARLTTTLILWLIYAAYLMLRSFSGAPDQGARYAAVLGVVGAVDIPIINRSVYWWRTIHPAVLITREGGSGLADPRMQATLGVCFLAFFLLFVWLTWVRNENMRLSDEVERLRQQALGHA